MNDTDDSLLSRDPDSLSAKGNYELAPPVSQSQSQSQQGLNGRMSGREAYRPQQNAYVASPLSRSPVGVSNGALTSSPGSSAHALGIDVHGVHANNSTPSQWYFAQEAVS